MKASSMLVWSVANSSAYSTASRSCSLQRRVVGGPDGAVELLTEALRLDLVGPKREADRAVVELGDPHPSRLPDADREDALVVGGVDQRVAAAPSSGWSDQICTASPPSPGGMSRRAMSRLYASMRAGHAADRGPSGRHAVGTEGRDEGHPLHLRLGAFVRLGQRPLEPAPDQHGDAGHHRLVRGQPSARMARWTSAQPVAGELELSVDRLTSGNQLYDRELRRRMDARRYPTIGGESPRSRPTDTHPRYLVTGDISFHGKTRSFEHEMDIEVRDDAVELSGDYVFDIREFGMKPPSMLMVRVYPEISVRVELHGTRDG